MRCALGDHGIVADGCVRRGTSTDTGITLVDANYWRMKTAEDQENFVYTGDRVRKEIKSMCRLLCISFVLRLRLTAMQSTWSEPGRSSSVMNTAQ